MFVLLIFLKKILSCCSRATQLIIQIYNKSKYNIKGALSGLRQFLTTESPLKMMKNTFYFNSNALFVLKIIKILS